MHIFKYLCNAKTKKYFVVKKLCYISLLLLIGLYACNVPENDTSLQSKSNACVSAFIYDISIDYANRLQQQYNWTDAITSSYQLSSSNQKNRLRTRRHEHISNSWQLRLNTKQQNAALQHHESTISHSINLILVVSRTMQLNLPTELISFPFHSFW